MIKEMFTKEELLMIEALIKMATISAKDAIPVALLLGKIREEIGKAGEEAKKKKE